MEILCVSEAVPGAVVGAGNLTKPSTQSRMLMMESAEQMPRLTQTAP